jgi:hypothetical protein
MDLLGWLVTSPNRRSMGSIHGRKRRVVEEQTGAAVIDVFRKQSGSYLNL